MTYYTWNQYSGISELLGKTILEFKVGDDNIYIICDDGGEYHMFHSQDCCESVYIESIVGDVNDLIGNPILLAEEVDSPEPFAGHDSYTWTFYKLATIKGYVDIRWLGESNGYYSESVDFVKVR